MPILSFSVSENLRKFIKSTLLKQDYKNQSDLIRNALTRLMNESELAGTEQIAVASPETLDVTQEEIPATTGDVILVLARDDEVTRNKLRKVERTYANTIKSKTVVNSREFQSVFYVFEGSLLEFQAFTTSLNSIKDLKNLRYIILE